MDVEITLLRTVQETKVQLPPTTTTILITITKGKGGCRHQTPSEPNV